MGNMSLFNVLELEGLNGRDHPSPTRLLQDSSQSSSGECGSDCSSLANTVQTNSNLNSFKQNDASRFYPSPDLEGFAYESCAPGSDRDWIIDLVNSIGHTSNSSSAKFRPTGSFDNSPSAYDAASSTLSPLPTRNVSPTPASSHIFISRNFTPSSFDEHLSDIDSDAMTFLNPYRTPEYCPEDVLEKNLCQDITSEPYHPGNVSGDEPCYLDGPDVALSSNDEYFVGHLARGDHRVTSYDDYVSASHTKDNHIQTPLYDYVVSTPENGMTSLPSIHHLATAAACHGHVQHNLSAQPLFMSQYRSGDSLAMEFETTSSPVNAPLDSSVFKDHAFRVQTPGYDPMDDDDECFYLDDFSRSSSPGYLPVDINTLNPDLDPDEDRWTTNSIEYDYECSHSS